MDNDQRRQLLDAAIEFVKSVREVAERLGQYSFESSRHETGEPIEASILSHWRAGRQPMPSWVEPALIAIVDDAANEMMHAHQAFMSSMPEILLTRARQLQALRAEQMSAPKRKRSKPPAQ